MKNTFVKIAVAGLVAAALINTSIPARAADPAEPAMENPAPKHNVTPFHGKIAAVDAAAMTLTIGKRTFKVTDSTRIEREGSPAKLSDAIVGENIGGAYKKADDGTLVVTSLNFTPGAGTEKKQKDAMN